MLTTRCLAFRRARARRRHLSRNTRGLSSTSATRSAARARRNAAVAVVDTGRPRPTGARPVVGAAGAAAAPAELSPLRRALDRTPPRSDISPANGCARSTARSPVDASRLSAPASYTCRSQTTVDHGARKQSKEPVVFRSSGTHKHRLLIILKTLHVDNLSSVRAKKDIKVFL